MISVPGSPARLCRSTFFLDAFGSSARVRQNGLERISATSRYLVTRCTTGAWNWRAAEKNFRFASTRSCGSFRLERHCRHGGIEMTAMKIYAEDGRNNSVDPKIHGSFLSFPCAAGPIIAADISMMRAGVRRRTS